MPPSYKPLAAGVQGIPEEIFNNPGITFEDAQKQQALARAQELANQRSEQQVRSEEMQIAEAQRQLEQQARQRDAIIGKFGAGGGEFNPDEGLRTAQRVALEGGDISTALDIEKALRARKIGGGFGGSGSAANMPLPEAMRIAASEQLGIELPPGTTQKDIATLTGIMRTRTYADQVGTYVNDPNRELNAQTKAARLAGEQVTKPSEKLALSVGASTAFGNEVDRTLERYVPYVSENRGVRFLAAMANPNSAAARYMGAVNLLAKQAALALEDRVTNEDYAIIKELSTPTELDTLETMMDKARELKGFIKRRTEQNLLAAESVNINVTKLKQMAGMSSPTPTPLTPGAAPGGGGVPLNPDGTPLSREQFMALRNRGQ